MTNGELFQTLYPNIVVKENGTCMWLFFGKDEYTHYTMPTSWWNEEAPCADVANNSQECVCTSDIYPSEISTKPIGYLTEVAMCELRHRFGDEVEFVVRDMLSGKGERWKNGR